VPESRRERAKSGHPLQTLQVALFSR
jgi:hypothetical protein